MSNDFTSTVQCWLDRLREGDPAARNELIRHSRERFRRLTRQMMRRYPGLREWEETSDVLQNVLIRLDRALQMIEVRTPRDFKCLAAVQIRRELIDLARHHFGPQGRGTHQMPPGHDGDPCPEPPDRDGDPYDLARWAAFHEFIEALPEAERQLWDLLYYQGLTQEESAALLGISPRTLHRRWQDARIDCGTALRDDWPL